MDVKVIASGSKGNCYKISDGKTSLLLDAGIGFKDIQKALDFNVGEIRGALVTHSHGDHCRCVDDLVKRGIKVYSTIDVAINKAKEKVCIVEPRVVFGLDSFNIMPFKVVHDVPCLGFRIDSFATSERLVYITDCGALPYIINDISILIIECNHDVNIIKRRVESGEMSRVLANRVVQTHLNIHKLCNYLEGGQLDTAKLKKIYLVHLSDDNSDADKFKTMVQAVVPEAEVVVC